MELLQPPRLTELSRGEVEVADDQGRQPQNAEKKVKLDEQLNKNFKIFREVDNPPDAGRGNLPYFL